MNRLLLVAGVALLVLAAVSYGAGWTVQEDTVVRVEVKIPRIG